MSSTAADDGVRIVMAQSCPSITGKSTLTYHIGMAGNEPQIRIHGNTGPGFFNDEWIPLFKVIDALPKGDPFTSRVLLKAFQGRSLNSYAFLMAALRNEGAVRRSSLAKRCWERADVDGFLARITAASGSGDDAKAAMPAPKAPAKATSKPTGKPAPSKPASKPVAKPAAKSKK
jgi:hypothetical protein